MLPEFFLQTYQTGNQLSIDLHGSSVKEAKTKLQEAIDLAEERGSSRATFITGVGKHSKNNYSVLYNKTVPEFLEQPEIKAKISQVWRDRSGAYEVVFKNEDELEKIEILKKSWAAFLYPKKTFEQVKQKAEEGSINHQFDLAIRYLEGYGTEKDFETAERWLISAADNGHHYANTQLGIMYDSGYGVKQNLKKALERHERGAKQNEAYSLFTLGCYYWLGKIVVRNDLKAVKYLSRAAKLNQVSAGYNLAFILLRGTETVSADPLETKRLLEIVAKADFVLGQVLLAKQHFFGWGIPKNYIEAHKWFQIASKSNDVIAQYYLGRIYNEGLGLPRDRSLAFEWFQKSATQGDKDAKTAVATFLIKGKVVPLNFKKGIDDLKDLAENGHPQSAGTLGRYYLNGIKGKLEKNHSLAIKHLSQAAEEDDVGSLRLLASLHFKGELDDANPNTGELFLRKATKLHDPEAAFLLALRLLKKGDTEDDEIVRLLEQSAEQKHAAAESLLGSFYLDGNLVIADEPRGLSLLMRAAKQGSTNAQVILGEHLIAKESKGDKLKAVCYFAAAAKSGDGDAMMWLAECYRDGIGIATDRNAYLEWLDKAIAADVPIAFYEKGHLWQLEKQDSKAFYYFLKAAEKGCINAKKSIYNCYLAGQGTQVDYEKALRWLKEVYEEEPSPLTEHLLGCFYADPAKEHYNLNEAIHWFALAISHGLERSTVNLTHLYEHPYAQKAVVDALSSCAKKSPLALTYTIKLSLEDELEIDDTLLQKVIESNNIHLQFVAIPCFLKSNRSAEAKMLLDRSSSIVYESVKEAPDCAYQIGRLYQSVNETISAMDWFSKASDQNHRAATIELFYLLYRTVQTNPTTNSTILTKLFEKGLEAANFGDLNAQYTVACVYLEGVWGNEQNIQKATYWLQTAAKSGDVDSQSLLNKLQAINESKNHVVLPEESSDKDENESALGCTLL